MFFEFRAACRVLQKRAHVHSRVSFEGYCMCAKRGQRDLLSSEKCTAGVVWPPLSRPLAHIGALQISEQRATAALQRRDPRERASKAHPPLQVVVALLIAGIHCLHRLRHSGEICVCDNLALWQYRSDFCLPQNANPCGKKRLCCTDVYR